MRVLKDIAVAMDCHEKTARRWWKKLRVPPDVRGHGANKWYDASFNRLLDLWRLYYDTHGTTPQLTRAKYAGQKPTDKFQLELLTWTPKNRPASESIKAVNQKIISASSRPKTKPAPSPRRGLTSVR